MSAALAAVLAIVSTGAVAAAAPVSDTRTTPSSESQPAPPLDSSVPPDDGSIQGPSMEPTQSTETTPTDATVTPDPTSPATEPSPVVHSGDDSAGSEPASVSAAETVATSPSAEEADAPALESGDTERAEPEALQEEWEDEDDDWDDESGPVDRTPRVSGVLQAGFKATFNAADELPDGTPANDEYTFQVEHTHVKLSGDLTHKLSWEAMPCITHMNDFSVITAKFTYQPWTALQITGGRFLLPFGQFNLRSLPGTYETLSRPLLYQSHEDRMIKYENVTPDNLIFTPRDDTGIQVGGNVWFGRDDVMQLSYNASVTNGLRALSYTGARFWDDNNNSKQYAGRAGLSYNGEKTTLAAGGSYLYNGYEDHPDTGKGLKQRVWGLDLLASVAYKDQKRLTLRGEYVDMRREITPDELLVSGDEGTNGAYVMGLADLTKIVSIYYQYDLLGQRKPAAQLDERFREVLLVTQRHSGGVSLLFGDVFILRCEYSWWDQPLGVPNAHRLALQTIVPF